MEQRTLIPGNRACCKFGFNQNFVSVVVRCIFLEDRLIRMSRLLLKAPVFLSDYQRILARVRVTRRI